MKRKKTHVSEKKEQLKEKIGMPLAVIVLFVCGLGFWGILVGLLIQEFSDFANAPFYSGLSEHFRDASFADFVPVILFTCVCVILIFLMFWRRYRPTSQPYDGIPVPHMHPAVASYAMRGGFFDLNRIIALTIIHLAYRKVLFASDEKCAWNKEWRSALDDGELSEIDYAVMRFLERVYFYIDKKEEKGRKGCVLYFDEINDFFDTDRKIYGDLITDIKQAFSTQCAREGVKENRGNLLTAITFLVIVGVFIVGILALFVSTFVIGDSSVLSGATIFFYSFPFVLCAIPLFIVALVVLSPGLPWDTNVGRQAAAFYEAVRTSSFPEITNEIDERWAGLTIVDKNSADCPFEVKIDARAIYGNLPAVEVGRWIDFRNLWARFFFMKSQKIRKSPKKTRENTQKTQVADLLGVAAVFALSGVVFLIPALLSQDTRDDAKNMEWATGSFSWYDTLFSSSLFHVVLAPLLFGIVLCVLVRLFYSLLDYGRLAFSSSKGKYSREIPDIHPATASIIASGGLFQVKRALSSSLLRLVSLGVLTIEKRENEYGDSTFVFMRTQKDSRLTKIDEAVMGLVDFAIDDRYQKRSRARAEELQNYKFSEQATGVAFLEDFPVVRTKEGEEYDSRVKKIFDAINEDLEERRLKSKLRQCVDGALQWVGAILVFVIPIFSVALFSIGFSVRGSNSALSGYLGGLHTLFYIFFMFINPILFLVFYEIIVGNRILLSKAGVSMWKDLRGLRRWLEDYTLLEERDVLSVKVWKEYMVYAAAMGLPVHVYDDFSQAIETVDSVYCDLAKDLDETL